MPGQPRGLERWTVAIFGCALAAAVVVPIAARVGPWSAAEGALACALPAPWLAQRLPESLRGAFGRRRLVSLAWLALALLALLQVGRLSVFMADGSRAWGSTVPDPLARDHQCLSAYVHAADLARRGEPNLYDERWYPAFRGLRGPAEVDVVSPVEGLTPWLEDPFEYPPPFLLLPGAALALSNSFSTIRAGWFVLHAFVAFGGAALAAAWVGGRTGLVAGLLIPLLAVSIPVGLELQFGQFHVAAVALALAGMIAFDARRSALGGALLAAAVVTKIFPGLLLVVLLALRRWRELAWTAGFGLAFALLALAWLGPAPFIAFFDYQLPRLASGAAFSFAERPELPAFIAARNDSVYGIAAKLRMLGVSGAGPGLGQLASWAYTALLLWLAWRARDAETRAGRLLGWVALLNLAALRSPVAPSAYVVVPSLWLLTLLASEVRSRAALVAAFAVAWLAVMGNPALPGRLDVAAALASQLFLLALNLAVLLRAPRELTRSGR